MATTTYKAIVQANGSLELSKEAQEALNLLPGDEVEIQMEDDDTGWDLDELRAAIDLGEQDVANGRYTTYTADTLHQLADDIETAGRRRLEAARCKHTE